MSLWPKENPFTVGGISNAFEGNNRGTTRHGLDTKGLMLNEIIMSKYRVHITPCHWELHVILLANDILYTITISPRALINPPGCIYFTIAVWSI